MNALSLIQKQAFIRNEFILMDETLSVKQFTINEYKEQVINLECIGHKTMIEKDTSYMRIGLILFMGLSALSFVVANVVDHSHHVDTWLWIAISMVYAWFSMVVYLSPLNNKLCLVNGTKDLVLLTDQPSEKEVREFVDEIFKRSKKVLLRKYSPDPDLPEEFTISHLNWLLEIGVIDNKEFNEMKANYYLNRNR